MICSVDGCDRRTVGQGLCRLHYERQRRNGTTSIQTPLEKLLARRVIDANGCWLLKGKRGKHPDGRRGKHPQINPSRKPTLLSRYIYEHIHGPIPSGRFICHTCDECGCFNPDHLFVGTPADNSADMVAKQRQARGERVGTHKLTEPEVIAIRADRRSHPAIARDYEVSAALIWQIKHYVLWKHVA